MTKKQIIDLLNNRIQRAYDAEVFYIREMENAKINDNTFDAHHFEIMAVKNEGIYRELIALKDLIRKG